MFLIAGCLDFDIQHLALIDQIDIHFDTNSTISPDGKTQAVITYYGSVGLRNIATDKFALLHGSRIQDFVLSYDDRLLAVIDMNHTFEIYDIAARSIKTFAFTIKLT